MLVFWTVLYILCTVLVSWVHFLKCLSGDITHSRSQKQNKNKTKLLCMTNKNHSVVFVELYFCMLAKSEQIIEVSWTHKQQVDSSLQCMPQSSVLTVCITAEFMVRIFINLRLCESQSPVFSYLHTCCFSFYRTFWTTSLAVTFWCSLPEHACCSRWAQFIHCWATSFESSWWDRSLGNPTPG